MSDVDVAAVRAYWSSEGPIVGSTTPTAYRFRRLALQALQDVPALLAALDQQQREIERLTKDHTELEAEYTRMETQIAGDVDTYLQMQADLAAAKAELAEAIAATVEANERDRANVHRLSGELTAAKADATEESAAWKTLYTEMSKTAVAAIDRADAAKAAQAQAEQERDRLRATLAGETFSDGVIRHAMEPKP